MMKSGNGDAFVCANNLFSTLRGEVPMSRVKGVDPIVVDQPVSTAKPDFAKDARWMLQNYEPRIDMSTISGEDLESQFGAFQMNVKGDETDEY